jgi:hypothetical protein
MDYQPRGLVSRSIQKSIHPNNPGLQMCERPRRHHLQNRLSAFGIASRHRVLPRRLGISQPLMSIHIQFRGGKNQSCVTTMVVVMGLSGF